MFVVINYTKVRTASWCTTLHLAACAPDYNSRSSSLFTFLHSLRRRLHIGMSFKWETVSTVCRQLHLLSFPAICYTNMQLDSHIFQPVSTDFSAFSFIHYPIKHVFFCTRNWNMQIVSTNETKIWVKRITNRLVTIYEATQLNIPATWL
jgi:hypothetical protein